MQISSFGQTNKTQNSKAKKYVLIGLIVAAVLLIVLLIMLVFLSNATPKTTTLSIDSQTKEYSNSTFIFDDGKIYVSLKDIANLIGYRYYEGGYKQYTQDKSSCYLESDDEVVVYELGNNKIYKTLNNDIIQYSEFTITEPVKKYEDKLYVISSALEKGCNIKLIYNSKTNQIIISTLPNLYNAYNDKAISGTYLNVQGLDESFENKKAILDGMIVVKTNIKETQKYGVISLDGAVTYLDIKYQEIKYVENLQQFIVKGENKYGVMAKDGTQIIKPEYNKIQLFDSINSLYYVEKNSKKGVLDKNGNVLGGNLYVEYDEIGIEKSLFPSESINNEKLLYDKCIIAKRNDKWGMFDIEGNLISNFNWDNFGYIDSKVSTNNLLLIDSKEGIVVCKNSKYGIINSDGTMLVECVFDKIFSEIYNGEKVYYLQFGDNIIELDDYLKQLQRNEEDAENDEEQNIGNSELETAEEPTQEIEIDN